MRSVLASLVVGVTVTAAFAGGGCGGGAAPATATLDGGGGAPGWIATGAAGPAEVTGALTMAHADAWRRLGPHRFQARTKIRVTLDGQPPDELEDEFLLEAGAGGRYHALRQNSRDQGFEHYFLDGELYVRPRYGRFVRRRPAEGEADRIRESAFGALAALGDLLGRFTAGRSEGRVVSGGRPALRLRLQPAAAPRPLGADLDGPRAWRGSVAVTALAGTMDVDAASGAPLAVNLTASFTFRQGDRAASAALEHVSSLTTGVDPPLLAPDHVTEPARPRYHVERQQLLEGLIPPGAGSP